MTIWQFVQNQVLGMRWLNDLIGWGAFRSRPGHRRTPGRQRANFFSMMW